MGWFDWLFSKPEKVQRRKGRMRRNPARVKMNISTVKRGRLEHRSELEKRRRLEEWRREQGNG